MPNICQIFQNIFLCQLGEQLAKTGITVSAIRWSIVLISFSDCSRPIAIVLISFFLLIKYTSRPGDGFSSSPTGDFVRKFKTTGSDRYFLMRRGLDGIEQNTSFSLKVKLISTRRRRGVNEGRSCDRSERKRGGG